MLGSVQQNEPRFKQLRLLVEEACCDLCSFEQAQKVNVPLEQVRVDREVRLAAGDQFADIRIQTDGQPTVFIEVKIGYTLTLILNLVTQKYGHPASDFAPGTRLVLLLAKALVDETPGLAAEITHRVHRNLTVEVWSPDHLIVQMERVFGVRFDPDTYETFLDVREKTDRAKAHYAFGGGTPLTHEVTPLESKLMWHFGFWRLRRLRELKNLKPEEVLVPGNYPEVVVLIADLCSFSSYVRDTRDQEVVRDCLTAFYSATRYQILNHGGMLYEFVGDEVIGLFGIPEHLPRSLELALNAAKAIIEVGDSVSLQWQRHLDRVQESGGVHIGMTVGDLQVVSLRPFSRTFFGVLGDSINMAARLMASAGSGEIIASNSLYHALPDTIQTEFAETPPLDARNVGRIKAWKRPRQPVPNLKPPWPGFAATAGGPGM